MNEDVRLSRLRVSRRRALAIGQQGGALVHRILRQEGGEAAALDAFGGRGLQGKEADEQGDEREDGEI